MTSIKHRETFEYVFKYKIPPEIMIIPCKENVNTNICWTFQSPTHTSFVFELHQNIKIYFKLVLHLILVFIIFFLIILKNNMNFEFLKEPTRSYYLSKITLKV